MTCDRVRAYRTGEECILDSIGFAVKRRLHLEYVETVRKCNLMFNRVFYESNRDPLAFIAFNSNATHRNG